MTQPDPTAGYRRTLTEAARERLLAEMSGGMKPCLWCIGVPVFDSRDELLTHIHDQHPPADLQQRVKATSDTSNGQAKRLFAIHLIATDGVDPGRVIAAVNALDPYTAQENP